MAKRISGRLGGNSTPSELLLVIRPSALRSLWPTPISNGNNSPPSARMVTPDPPVNAVKKAPAQIATAAAPPRTFPNSALKTRMRRLGAPLSASR